MGIWDFSHSPEILTRLECPICTKLLSQKINHKELKYKFNDDFTYVNHQRYWKFSVEFQIFSMSNTESDKETNLQNEEIIKAETYVSVRNLSFMNFI